MSKCVFLSAFMLLLPGCFGDDKPKFTKEELDYNAPVQKEVLPTVSGGLVLAVGGETLTADEIIAPMLVKLVPIARSSDFERFKELAGPELERVFVEEVSSILLYSQAKRQMGWNIEENLEKAAEAEIRKFVVGFGGDYARAEETLRLIGMDWQSFKEYQKRVILSQSYIVSQLPNAGPITDSELLEAYEQMKEQFFVESAIIKFRLIDIEPAKLKVFGPSVNRTEEAMELAKELVERIREGEDFGAFAKAYSHGHRRGYGGLWKAVNPESLVKPYDTLGVMAEKMEPGQLAGPIEAGGHIFIMKLEEKKTTSYKPLKDVQPEIEAKIILERRTKALVELENKLAQQAAPGQRKEFIDFCLAKIYQMSNI